MVPKHSILAGIVISVALLLISTSLYPGGSISDKNSEGFIWSQNFISNLFQEKAINGADNPGRIWAGLSMLFLSLSFGLFFIRFSKKIPHRSSALTVRYLGTAGMICNFLIITPYHDIMVTLGSTFFLASVFYITVFVYRSRLTFLKVLCTTCMLTFYYTLFLFGTGDLRLLAIMQKITFLHVIVLILLLEYFTGEHGLSPKSDPKTNKH